MRMLATVLNPDPARPMAAPTKLFSAIGVTRILSAPNSSLQLGRQIGGHVDRLRIPAELLLDRLQWSPVRR